MKTNYSFSNKSDINISFNIKKEIENNYVFKKGTKQKFPDQKIFRINSLIFDDEKEEQEIYTKYDCIYSEKYNSLFILINENMNYSEFTKDKLINILEFSNSIGIDYIYILINKKNHNFINILQDMLIVGFKFGKNFPLFTIDGTIYKALQMSIKDIKQEIKQIDII